MHVEAPIVLSIHATTSGDTHPHTKCLLPCTVALAVSFQHVHVHYSPPLTLLILFQSSHLAGGAWYRLTEEGVSVPMDKYVVTEITPYLVIDPQHVPDPRPLDDEEDIEIVTRVSIEEIVRMIREGDFNLVGGWGALLALEKLRELGEIT